MPDLMDELSCHGLVVQPGDTLMVAVPVETPMDQGARFRDELRARLAGVDVVVVAATQLAVYRPVHDPGD
jgi:hypothetical protein